MEVLEKMIVERAEMTIPETIARYKDHLVKFLVYYAYYAVPNKDEVKARLNEASQNQLQLVLDDAADREEAEADDELSLAGDEYYDHTSLLVILTASDIAYVLWQLVNSSQDWDMKIEMEREGNDVQDVKYKCGTRWTSNRKLPAMEDRGPDDEAMKFYNECHAWAKDLKNRCNLELTVALNRKSVEIGIFKKAEVEKRGDVNYAHRHSRGQQEEVEVPLFELSNLDMPEHMRVPASPTAV